MPSKESFPPSVSAAPEPDPAQFADIPDPLDLTQPVKTTPLSYGSERVGPTRQALTRRRKAIAAVSLTWLLALLVLFGLRRDLPALAWSELLLLDALPLMTALACAHLALSEGPRGFGAARSALWSAATLGALLPTLLSFALLSRSDGGLGFPDHAICFALAFAGALPPLVMSALALPHTFVSRPRLRSAVLGVAAGSGGALFTNLHCEATSRLHVSCAHHGPALVLALLASVALAYKLRV